MVIVPVPVHACVKHCAYVAVKRESSYRCHLTLSIFKSDCPMTVCIWIFFIILRILLLSHREVVSHFLVSSKTKIVKKLDYTGVQNNEDYFFLLIYLLLFNNIITEKNILFIIFIQ